MRLRSDTQDMIRLLQEEVQRPGFKKWIGLDVAVRVHKLEAVRDWGHHLACLRVRYEGSVAGGVVVIGLPVSYKYFDIADFGYQQPLLHVPSV